MAKFYWLALSLWVFIPDIMCGAGADCVQTPLFEDGNMIQVPVSAFGKTLYFVVDTGFTISAIDTQYRSYLGDPLAIYSAVSPLGAKKEVPVYHCPALALGGQPLGLEKIAGLDLKMLRFIAGRPCDGILGMDWFEKNVVSMDFDAGTFSVGRTVPEIVKNTFFPVALEPADGYYTMPARVNQNRILDLMIDTGDSSSLSLNQLDWAKFLSTGQTKTMHVTEADAVNQVAQTRIAVLARLTIQGLNYTNLHATLIQKPGQSSRLGLGFFQRHRVTFDFAGRMLYLQPGRKYSTPDIEDMSGLHLLRYGEQTTVYSVDENSPAAVQGIMAGDVIETVNGQPALALTMDAIRQILRSGDRNQVALQLRRSGRLLAVRIILQQMI